MSNEATTNETPLVTRAQHQTLLDAADVITHLAEEARKDFAAGRAPEGVDRDLEEVSFKLSGMAMLLEVAGMVSDG